MSTKSPDLAVLLADIIGSRNVDGFRQLRDRKLREITKHHSESDFVLGPYAVTAWDEFQNLLRDVARAPSVVWDLRCHFHPLGLWIAIGVGDVESLPREGEPINVGGAGEAFELARCAMDRLKSGAGRKYRVLTCFKSEDQELNRSVNLVYKLVDTLVQKITKRQWETILVHRQTQRLDKTAARLRIDESTVSRNLQRGYYWQIEDTVKTLGSMLSRGHS